MRVVYSLSPMLSWLQNTTGTIAVTIKMTSGAKVTYSGSFKHVQDSLDDFERQTPNYSDIVGSVLVERCLEEKSLS